MLANRAFLIYVALGEDGRSFPVPELELNTENEKNEWIQAQKRRETRLQRAEEKQKV
jgi:acyl-CoA hydrolase